MSLDASSLFAQDGFAQSDAGPLYVRLQDRIKQAIKNGSLKPLAALPGERDIAQSLNVSRVTVRKALSGLVSAGLLEQRQGSGTFVSRQPPTVEQSLSRLTSFSEDMRLRGFETTSKWLGREISPPSTKEAFHLALSMQDRVCRLRRLRSAGGVPMAIELAAVPCKYLANPQTVKTSLYAVLEASGAKPVRALQRLSAANLSDDDASLLSVPAGSATLSIERISYVASGQPVEFTRSFYRGDIYDFIAELNLGQD
jgi:GntR family transcriptional regulator